MTNPKLAQIPDDLLMRTGDGDVARARRLARWLEHARYRPTLLDLEQERARRRESPQEAC